MITDFFITKVEIKYWLHVGREVELNPSQLSFKIIY